jgi:uncharacterized protein (DUF4415 family)
LQKVDRHRPKHSDHAEVPPLEAQFFERASLYRRDRLLQRGRLRGSGSKSQTTIRLSNKVPAWFRASGTGWQARLDDVLKAHVARASRRASSSGGRSS